MSQHAMSCKEVVELVTAYLEGVLDAQQRRRFDDHLAICDGCTIYLEQMRQTISLTGRLTEQDVEPAGMDRLLTAFRDWHA